MITQQLIEQQIKKEIKDIHTNYIRCVMCGLMAVSMENKTYEPLCFKCNKNNKEAMLKQ